MNDRLVAGTIVVSENNGQAWKVTHSDNEVPVTLTSIIALTDTLLLAVGHDSVILRSEDAGFSWEMVMRDGESGEPLLGAWSADGEHIFAYGSFGKFLESEDAGKTFTARELPIFGEYLSAMAGDNEDVRIFNRSKRLVKLKKVANESVSSS